MPAKNLESTGTTLDGRPIALRPIRPEDEPVLQDLFAHMSQEDVRLRFLVPMRELSHALAARLSHLDYGREMALVAQHDEMRLGVARYSADPDRPSAEFAVAVRSDWHGRGVGHLLMARLIEVAQESGIGELVGLVLQRTSRCWICAENLASALRRSRTTRPCSGFENRWLPCRRVRLLSESPFIKNRHDPVTAMRREQSFVMRGPV
jgi:acetyltransferase